MIPDVAALRPGVVTRSISPENPTGAPGGGARATKGTGVDKLLEVLDLQGQLLGNDILLLPTGSLQLILRHRSRVNDRKAGERKRVSQG